MKEKRRLARHRAFVQRAITRYHDLVYRLAFRIVGNRSDAEDVTQEVYLRLLRNPDALRSVKSERAYLVSIALNTARTTIRQDNNRTRREEAWAMKFIKKKVDIIQRIGSQRMTAELGNLPR